MPSSLSEDVLAELDFPTPVRINDQMLKRRILWDMTPCERTMEILHYMEFPPASAEVESTEHIRSHQRIMAVGIPTLRMVQHLSHQAAEVVRATMMVTHGDELANDPFLDEATLSSIINMSAIAILAELTDVNFIESAGPVV